MAGNCCGSCRERHEGHQGNEEVGGRDEGHAGQDEGQGDEGHEKLRVAMKAMKAKKAETILADGASAPTVRSHSYGDESVVMEMGN